MTQQFTTTIKTDERGRVFVAIPFNPKEAWGKQTRFYVTMVISGITLSTSLGAKGGQYFFPFSKDMQVQTGLKAGDEITVAMSLTIADKIETDLPEDLSVALDKNKKAKDFFATLTGFYKNSYVKWITAARQETTRIRRVVGNNTIARRR